MGKISLKREKGRGHADPAPVTYASRPLITPPGGDYTDLDPVAVTITTTEAGGASFYTDDGTTPSDASTPYTVPIDVEPPVGEGADIQVRAITTVAGKSPSDIAGALYHFDAPITPPAGSWDTRTMRSLPTDGVFSTWTGPTGPTIYMATDGDDGNDGSDLAHPVATITRAQALMAPGYTLLLKGGHYWFSSFNWLLAGTATDRITIASVPGEIAWLHLDYQEFYDDPANSWVPVVGGVADEYESVNSFTAEGVTSFRFADSMVPIQGTNVATFESENEVAPLGGKDDDYYIGPCATYDTVTGKFRIRLTHTNLTFLETADFAGFGGDYNYKGETDPRLIPIIAARRQPNIRFHLPSYVTFKDVVCTGGGAPHALRMSGTTGTTLDNLWLYPGQSGVHAVGCTDLTIQNSKLHGCAAPWSSRASMKYHGSPTYAGIINVCRNPTITRNRITDSADMWRMDGWADMTDSIGDYTISYNLFEHCSDDMLYMPGKEMTGIKNIYQNIFRGCNQMFPTTGGGQNVVETDPDAGVYIHHNICDYRRGAFGGPPRTDITQTDLYYGGSSIPSTNGSIFMSHGGSTYERMDVHLYHNIFMVYEGREWYYLGLGTGLRNGETEAFNNIWIQTTGNVVESLRDPGTPYTFLRGNNIAWSLGQQTTGAIPTELYTDPLLLNYNTDRFNPDEDLHIASNSPCVNGGRVLDVDWPTAAGISALDSGLPDIGPIPYHTTLNGMTLTQIFGPDAEV